MFQFSPKAMLFCYLAVVSLSAIAESATINREFIQKLIKPSILSADSVASASECTGVSVKRAQTLMAQVFDNCWSAIPEEVTIDESTFYIESLSECLTTEISNETGISQTQLLECASKLEKDAGLAGTSSPQHVKKTSEETARIMKQFAQEVSFTTELPQYDDVEIISYLPAGTHAQMFGLEADEAYQLQSIKWATLDTSDEVDSFYRDQLPSFHRTEIEGIIIYTESKFAITSLTDVATVSQQTILITETQSDSGPKTVQIDMLSF